MGRMSDFRIKRFLPKFGLRAIFALLTVVSAPLAIHVRREQQYRRRLAAVSILNEAGDLVETDGGRPLSANEHPLKIHESVGRVSAGPTLSEAEASAILNFPTLRRLDLSGTNGKAVPAFRDESPLGQALFDAQLQEFAKLPLLEELDLHNTRVTDAGVRHLADMRTLRKLCLLYSGVTDEGVRHLANLRDLEEIDLGGTRVTDDGVRHFAALTELRLLNLRITGVSDDGVRHLAALTKLRALDLLNTGVGDEGVRHLAVLTDLCALDLGGTRVGDDGVRHFAALCSLQYLNLSGTKITGNAFGGIPALPQLERLDLSYNDDVGDELFRYLRRVPKLTRLDLDGTRVSAEGLEDLAWPGSLGLISLRATQVSDEGLKALATCRSPLSLVLSNCRGISDAGLLYLADMKSLRNIDLDGTSVTADGAARLHAKLPQAWIRWGPVNSVKVIAPETAKPAGGGFF